MYQEVITAVSMLIACLSAAASFIALRRARKQVAGMAEALADIRNGNGNRRILAGPHEITAPLAYEINDVVRSYEDRLLAVRRTEEMNKRLMTSLSHDVRTPLTTLIGYLDAAHKRIVTEKECQDYVETARRKAYDLKEYIDVLFDWFKLNSDEFTMQIEEVELSEVTRNILIDWIPVFEEQQIEYAASIPDGPVRAALDSDAYTRILNNLIQNAVTHSRADRIEIAFTQQDGDIKIRIQDNGIGIKEEDLPQIFERLYKCDKGRSEKGSGLGLSIVRQLTEKMGGSITAQSRPGEGVAFMIRFPCPKEEGGKLKL